MSQTVFGSVFCFWVALGAVPVVQGQAQTLTSVAPPSQHESYDVELEPHLVWQWNSNEIAQDDGIGLGFRASIPVIRRGPLAGIDNNLSVSFGLVWAHFPGCRARGIRCAEDDIWIPAVAQWNFYLTPSISLFPELGLGFRDAVISTCSSDSCRRGSLEVHPIMWFGARFRLMDAMSIVARLGTPWLQLGVSWTI
ncbi:MAG: hypothetical protein RL701_1650 [Pseudomonadota bacterium]|jgi:hypothetical protein